MPWKRTNHDPIKFQYLLLDKLCHRLVGMRYTAAPLQQMMMWLHNFALACAPLQNPHYSVLCKLEQVKKNFIPAEMVVVATPPAKNFNAIFFTSLFSACRWVCLWWGCEVAAGGVLLIFRAQRKSQRKIVFHWWNFAMKSRHWIFFTICIADHAKGDFRPASIALLPIGVWFGLPSFLSWLPTPLVADGTVLSGPNANW